VTVAIELRMIRLVAQDPELAGRDLATALPVSLALSR
jgi:hypothetical protein